MLKEDNNNKSNRNGPKNNSNNNKSNRNGPKFD